MNDIARKVLKELKRAFSEAERPEHFTNHLHCDECADHDETLRSHTPDTIGMDELGNPGWDPICFITVPGYLYYMPGFARLAMEPQQLDCAHPGPSWRHYLGQFLIHLSDDRTTDFDAPQAAATLRLLEFIRDQIEAEIEQGVEPTTYSINCFEDLENRIAQLREIHHDSNPDSTSP